MMAQFCPHCGHKLSDQPAGRLRSFARAYGQYRQSRVTTFQSSAVTPWQPAAPAPAGQPAPAFASAERRTPFRPQNIESDFLTPLAQALGTGAFVSAGGIYMAWFYHGVYWYHGLAFGVIAAGAYWLIAMAWNRNLLWATERIIGADLDGDGYEGQPETPPVRLEVVHQDQDRAFSKMFRFDLPDQVTEDDFLNFARGVTQEGRGLAETAWIGRGKPFSRKTYNDLLASLDQAGVIRWVDQANHVAGRELTGSGRRSLLQYVYGALAHSHSHNGGASVAETDLTGVGEGRL